MVVSPEEANRALDEIQSVTEQTKRMAAYAGADVLFIRKRWRRL